MKLYIQLRLEATKLFNFCRILKLLITHFYMVEKKIEFYRTDKFIFFRSRLPFNLFIFENSFFFIYEWSKLQDKLQWVSKDCPDFGLSLRSDPKIVCCCMHFLEKVSSFCARTKSATFCSNQFVSFASTFLRAFETYIFLSVDFGKQNKKGYCSQKEVSVVRCGNLHVVVKKSFQTFIHTCLVSRPIVVTLCKKKYHTHTLGYVTRTFIEHIIR